MKIYHYGKLIRDTKGKFKGSKRHWLALLPIVYLLLWINFHLEVREFSEARIVHYASAEASVGKEVLIELAPLTTKEEVEAKIRETFPENPDLFVKIAKCESHLLVNARNPKTPDHGVFQINQTAHGMRLKQLGLDPWDARDNIKYARMLYERNGTRDWNSSRHCWNS